MKPLLPCKRSEIFEPIWAISACSLGACAFIVKDRGLGFRDKGLEVSDAVGGGFRVSIEGAYGKLDQDSGLLAFTGIHIR